jgi:hypothetical protein
VEETKNVGKTPRDVGKEGEVLPGLQTEWEEPPQQPSQQRQEERPLEPQSKVGQHELGQLEGPVGEAERGMVVPPLDAQAEVPTSGGRLSTQGPTR